MSLLSMAQDIAADTPVGTVNALFGNSDVSAIRLLAALQRAGEVLSKYKNSGWTILVREFEFTTKAVNTFGNLTNNSPVVTGIPDTSQILPVLMGVSGAGVQGNTYVQTVDSPTQVTMNKPSTSTAAGTGVPINFGQDAYQLPSDFRRHLSDTDWDRGRRWPLIGPRSPQQWQLYKSGLIGVATFQRRWRIKPRVVNGVIANYFTIDPVPFDNDTTLVFEYVSGAWCSSAAGAPQTRWQADTDVSLIEEDILKLDARWRFLRRLGLSYSDEMSEAFAECAKAYALDGGMPILDLAAQYETTLVGPWNVPDSGFGNVSS